MRLGWARINVVVPVENETQNGRNEMNHDTNTLQNLPSDTLTCCCVPESLGRYRSTNRSMLLLILSRVNKGFVICHFRDKSQSSVHAGQCCSQKTTATLDKPAHPHTCWEHSVWCRVSSGK